jgi:hypothetical protein
MAAFESMHATDNLEIRMAAENLEGQHKRMLQAVSQLVEALYFKPEGREFDFR